MRHPDDILADLASLTGTRRTDVGQTGLELVHEIIADLRDSYQLAINNHLGTGINPQQTHQILTEVDDYVVNHYGQS